MEKDLPSASKNIQVYKNYKSSCSKVETSGVIDKLGSRVPCSCLCVTCRACEAVHVKFVSSVRVSFWIRVFPMLLLVLLVSRRCPVFFHAFYIFMFFYFIKCLLYVFRCRALHSHNFFVSHVAGLLGGETCQEAGNK